MDAVSDRFAAVFDRVKNGSDRTRSALYVFMIANFALFLTVYGADLYPRPVERLDDFIDAIACIKGNKANTDSPRLGSKLNCEVARFYAERRGYRPGDIDSMLFSGAIQNGDQESGQNKGQSLYDLLLRKRLETLVSDEVESLRIQLPFMSLSFDIDYLWLLTSFFGPLGMIIIVSLFRAELEEIKFARQYLVGEEEIRVFRARLLLSTQVLLRQNKNDKRLTRATNFVQRGFIYLIFLLPILTSAIQGYYDSFLVDMFGNGNNGWRNNSEAFWQEVGVQWSEHPLMQIIWCVVTLMSWAVMIPTVKEFFEATRGLRMEYWEIAKL